MYVHICCCVCYSTCLCASASLYVLQMLYLSILFFCRMPVQIWLTKVYLTNCITGITPNQLKIDQSLYQLGDQSPILMAASDYLPVIQILKKGNHRQLFRSYLSFSVWYTLYIIGMTVLILSFRHTNEHLWSS